MRRDVVRVLGALGMMVAAALPATVGAAASGPQVEIRSGSACGAAAYCISPSTLTVPAGATVLWHNLTGVPLVISRCSPATCPGTGPGTGPDAGPASSSLGAGSESGGTFLRPGTYNYSFVAGGLAVLSGTVTVTAVGAPAGRAVAAAPPVAAAAAPAPAAPRPVAVAPVQSAVSPLLPALVPAPAAPAVAAPAGPQVATPSTGGAPPWGLALLLGALGAALVGLGRRQRRRDG
ncbi:MAG TPA: hypothetical protein VGL20_16130 [Candidatus Dormibacteraeota bacterium]